MLKRNFTNLLSLVFLLFSTTVFADSAIELAKKSENPIETMVSVPFVSNFYFNYGRDNTLQYVLDMKPIIPFSLNNSWNLITRTIIPIANQQSLPQGNRFTAVGDINPSFFISPAQFEKIIWGIGPAFILPTASNQQLGQGKYSVGPTIAVLTMPGSWVVGVVASNVWSIAGETSRPYVNEMSFQYFINYNFPKGWFITSAPIITATWSAPSNQRWTIPFGIGGGRVFNIGKQAISSSLQYYQNVKTPQLQSNWELEVVVSLLFPETS